MVWQEDISDEEIDSLFAELDDWHSHQDDLFLGIDDSIFFDINKNIDSTARNIEGEYECLEYSGDQKNDWHYVSISASDDDFIWMNKAGVSWKLSLDEFPFFEVGEECPYFRSGHTYAEIALDEEGNITGIYGPWHEFYSKMVAQTLEKNEKDLEIVHEVLEIEESNEVSRPLVT